MKKVLASILLCASLFMMSVSPTLAQVTTSFEEQDKARNAAANRDNACVLDGVVTIRGIECLVANILTVAVSGIGFAGFVMLLVGSFQYLLSGGSPKGTEGGKNTMTFAIVGLVVALSSWIILNFIASFTGVQTIKTFSTFFSG